MREILRNILAWIICLAYLGAMIAGGYNLYKVPYWGSEDYTFILFNCLIWTFLLFRSKG